MKVKREGNRKRKIEKMVSHVQSRKRLKEIEKAQQVVVVADPEAPPSIQDEILDSEAELEDKIVPKAGEVEEEENSELSDPEFLEDIFAHREKPIQVQAEDIELAESFLDSLGEDLMESDFVDLI